ncbi:unnamed protein product [Polarella glacialis]|uniref:Uncharacterized protein n=1 Tax=Polarella glacialis TaxID=89957 RepID=A0A813HKI4_POLGL|nr:unnamed protein product [Polarella glacialis]
MLLSLPDLTADEQQQQQPQQQLQQQLQQEAWRDGIRPMALLETHAEGWQLVSLRTPRGITLRLVNLPLEISANLQQQSRQQHQQQQQQQQQSPRTSALVDRAWSEAGAGLRLALTALPTLWP